MPYDIRQSELKPTQKLIVFQMTELTYEGGTLVANSDDLYDWAVHGESQSKGGQ